MAFYCEKCDKIYPIGSIKIHDIIEHFELEENIEERDSFIFGEFNKEKYEKNRRRFTVLLAKARGMLEKRLIHPFEAEGEGPTAEEIIKFLGTFKNDDNCFVIGYTTLVSPRVTFNGFIVKTKRKLKIHRFLGKDFLCNKGWVTINLNDYKDIKWSFYSNILETDYYYAEWNDYKLMSLENE